MTNVLNPETQTLFIETNATEAAHDRFFFIREAQRLSLIFYAANADLLSDDKGVFLQAGMTPDGRLVELQGAGGSGSAADAYDRVITAGFDASERAANSYTWSVMTANIKGGREKLELRLDGHQLSARRAIFDAQGVCRNVSDSEDPSQALSTLRWLAYHERTAEYAASIRERRRKAEEHLRVFVVDNLTKLAPTKLSKQIEALEENLARLSFGRPD